MHSLGILGSTNGTDMLAIIDAIQQKKLNAVINIVASNKPEAGILSRAQQYGLKSQFVDSHNKTRDEYDAAISKIMRENKVDLIVLIGYMRILSQAFVTEWKNKIINVHPSLLPDFAGKMNLDIYKEILALGLKETGCTVHLVTEEVDQGPILLQERCPVLAHDTVDTLKSRVQKLEGEILVKAIKGMQYE